MAINPIRKKVVVIMLVFALGFSVPLYTARSAALVLWVVKEFGLDLIARALARRLLTNLGDSVVNSINNLGIEKGQQAPTFVQNWKKFLANAQTIGENQFRAQLNYSIQKGILCDDLRGPLSLAFQASGAPYVDIGQTDIYDELKQSSLTPFQTKIKCTIPNNVRETFKKDFAKGGGWETWSRLVEPQNNIAGALAISLEELEKQRSSQESARQSEAVGGGGFTGMQGSCRGTPDVRGTVCYNNCYDPLIRTCNVIPDLNRKNLCVSDANKTCASQCQGQTSVGAGAQCNFLGKTLTPAKILGENAAQWFDNNSKWLVTSDELSEIIMSVINAAVNKLANFAKDKTGFQAVSPNSQDNSASQAGDKTQGAQQDCVNSCITQTAASCDNPLSTPEEKSACQNRNRADCDQRCSVPGTGF